MSLLDDYDVVERDERTAQQFFCKRRREFYNLFLVRLVDWEYDELRFPGYLVENLLEHAAWLAHVLGVHVEVADHLSVLEREHHQLLPLAHDDPAAGDGVRVARALLARGDGEPYFHWRGGCGA